MDKNFANRMACDIIVNEAGTHKPIAFIDTANVSTAGFSGDKVYSKAKGKENIPFYDEVKGTMSMELQEFPFSTFALFNDGTINATGLYSIVKKITCATAGEISIPTEANKTVVAGSVFVYPEGKYGLDDAKIAGTFATNKFTATTDGDIAKDSVYEVAYMVTNTSAKSIPIGSKKIPKVCEITQKTLYKDATGTLTPVLLVANNASIQMQIDLTHASEGDPQTLKITWDIHEDVEGETLRIIELEDEA